MGIKQSSISFNLSFCVESEEECNRRRLFICEAGMKLYENEAGSFSSAVNNENEKNNELHSIGDPKTHSKVQKC